jgi:hypothetical protein
MEVKGLQGRVAELDKENRELRDNKYALDSRVSEMSHKLGSSEGQVKTLSAEVSHLQAQFQTVSRCSLSLSLSHQHGASRVHRIRRSGQSLCTRRGTCCKGRCVYGSCPSVFPIAPTVLHTRCLVCIVQGQDERRRGAGRCASKANIVSGQNVHARESRGAAARPHPGPCKRLCLPAHRYQSMHTRADADGSGHD